MVHSSQNTGGELRTKGVPDSILGFGSGSVIRFWPFDGYSLLSIDRLSWYQVLGDKELLFAFCHEYTRVSVRFKDLETFAQVQRKKRGG